MPASERLLWGLLLPYRVVRRQLVRFRPAGYDELVIEEQRVVDTLLWTAVMCVASMSVFFSLYLYFGSVSGGIAMIIGALASAFSALLVRSGRRTASVAVLAASMIVLLDYFVLTTGGRESTTTLWYAAAPFVVVGLLPAKRRVPALIVILLHQVALSSLVAADLAINMRRAGTVGLSINYVLAPTFAGAFGFATAIAGGDMMQRLNQAENDMRITLTHIMQGFFVVDRSGKMVVTPSEELQSWFGGGQEGDDIVTCLSRRHPEFGERFRLHFDALVAGELPVEACLAGLPDQLRFSGRTYGVRYAVRANAPGAEWARLVATIDDITELCRRDEASLQRQALTVFVRGLQQDPVNVAHGVARSQEIVDHLEREPETPKWPIHMAALRTSAEERGLSVFSTLLDHAESVAASSGREAGVHVIIDAWSHVRRVFDELNDDQVGSGVRASRLQYDTLLHLVEGGANKQTLASHLATWHRDSAAPAS